MPGCRMHRALLLAVIRSNTQPLEKLELRDLWNIERHKVHNGSVLSTKHRIDGLRFALIGTTNKHWSGEQERS